MNVLILGSGGREHALGWAVTRSPSRPTLYSLPGNPGLAELGRSLPGDPADPEQVRAAVREKEIDLVIVGPEAPLVAGIADVLRADGVRVFGPSAAASALEGSKVFAKELMQRHGIPTADFAVIEDADAALAHAGRITYPHVIKADGLAAGKGALIVRDRAEAAAAVERIMIRREFGASGDRIVFEEFLTGEEMSVFVIASGEHYRMLPSSQDYKRAQDGDRGLNTGGMGSTAPVVSWSRALEERVRRQVIEPALAAMVREGCPYTGLLYAGLMVRDGRPQVVEFNCRFGDPETQALVPILAGDLHEAMWAASDPAADQHGLPDLEHDGRSCVCVVVASGGYPGPVRKGLPISGVEEAAARPDTVVFHAGTTLAGEQLVTGGGRVLGVTGSGPSLPLALERAYEAAALIEFEGAFYRRDIGWRGIQALGCDPGVVSK